MAEDADVPPLEDMSSVLHRVLCCRDVKTDDSSSSRIPVVASSGSACSDVCAINERISPSVSGCDSVSVCVLAIRAVQIINCQILVF